MMKALLSLFTFAFLMALLVGWGVKPARAAHAGWDRGIELDEARQLAYYASGSGGVTIVDVRDPAHISLVSNAIQTQGAVEDIFYDGATQRL